MQTENLTKLVVVAAAVLCIGGTAAEPAMAADCADSDMALTRSTSADSAVRAEENRRTRVRAEAAVACLTNQQRTARGLRPLANDPRLNVAALWHSLDMMVNHYFAHDSPDGVGPGDRAKIVGYCAALCYVGENIAAGYTTPRAVVGGWMDSAGHRDNILRPAYRHIGVGVMLSPPESFDGWGGTFTQMFGRT